MSQVLVFPPIILPIFFMKIQTKKRLEKPIVALEKDFEGVASQCVEIKILAIAFMAIRRKALGL